MKEITFSDVLGMFNTVLEWNTLAGNQPTQELTEVYRQLTLAEYEGKGEFLEGYRTRNHEMVLDGIGDMTFTGMFWVATEKFNEEDLYDSYTLAVNQVRLAGVSLPDTVDAMKFFIERKSSEGFLIELLTLLICLEDQYDLLRSFQSVSESNFSKFPKVEDVEDPEKELEIILDKGRYVGLDYKEFEGRYIFTAMQDLQDDVRFDKPKIIKSSQFVEVSDLTQFIY